MFRIAQISKYGITFFLFICNISFFLNEQAMLIYVRILEKYKRQKEVKNLVAGDKHFNSPVCSLSLFSLHLHLFLVNMHMAFC